MDKICLVKTIFPYNVSGSQKYEFLCDGSISFFAKQHSTRNGYGIYFCVNGRLYSHKDENATCEKCIRKNEIRILFK